MNTEVTTIPVTRRRGRRPLLAAAGAALALGLALTAGSAANAAVPGYLNPSLMRTTHVTGTDCAVHVSMWQNAYHYPGAGAYVTCSSGHTISMKIETDWAFVSGGVWHRYGVTGRTYAGAGTRSRTLLQTWQVLGGARQWRGVAYVWVDGVYRGWAPSRSGVWTAGT
jgi:hypothetical protein